MTKVIGIISYFPDKWNLRQDKLIYLHQLLNQCKFLFNLPILIIAQNWKDSDYTQITDDHPNVTILKYPKLGITGARIELQKQFLLTNYDLIILLDDDCKLVGKTGYYYLQEIDKHPNKLGSYSLSLHKLMAIPRDIYKEIEYTLEYTPDNEDKNKKIFEDRYAFWTFTGKHPELVYRFETNITGLKEVSLVTLDKKSSWSKGLSSQDMKDMINRTNKLIETKVGKDINSIYASIGAKFGY